MNEVEVGIPVPEVIRYATKRLTGVRVGEQLLVGGRLISPDEALRVGLVDEVVEPGRVVERALEWSDALLGLPPEAMAETRRRCRRDLVDQFERIDDSSVQAITDRWFGDETQAALHSLAERIGHGR